MMKANVAGGSDIASSRGYAAAGPVLPSAESRQIIFRKGLCQLAAVANDTTLQDGYVQSRQAFGGYENGRLEGPNRC